MVIKPLGTVISITTANTVSNIRAVYVTNNTASPVLITTANSTANVGSLYIMSNASLIIQKGDTDTIQGTGLYATPIAFTQ